MSISWDFFLHADELLLFIYLVVWLIGWLVGLAGRRP
jgi:hypothetical protein